MTATSIPDSPTAHATPDALTAGPAAVRDSPPAPAAAFPPTIIDSSEGWRLINAQELWRHRELLFYLVWRDVKVRYKQTALGAAWALLQPLLMMVVFTIFFSRMAGVSTGPIPYPLFAFAGLLPWTFFSTALSAGGMSVIGSERLITKIYFPRLSIPFAAVGAAVVDFAIAFGFLVIMMLWYGYYPGPGFLLLPVVFLAILSASLGLGTLLAALNVSYRDFRYVIPFLIQLGMFATPSVYMGPRADKGTWVDTLLLLNPMNGLIAAFRAAALGTEVAWGPALVGAAISVGLFFLGCLYYRKVEDNFADII